MSDLIYVGTDNTHRVTVRHYNRGDARYMEVFAVFVEPKDDEDSRFVALSRDEAIALRNSLTEALEV